MADDGSLPADRTPPRHLLQADLDYPGSVLLSASGNEITRITAGVEACRWLSLPGVVRRPAFTLLFGSISDEKKNTAFCGFMPTSLAVRIGRYKGTWTTCSVHNLKSAFPRHYPVRPSRSVNARRVVFRDLVQFLGTWKERIGWEASGGARTACAELTTLLQELADL